MNEDYKNAWIFLSAGMVGDTEPVTYRSILGVADGINHAIPTHEELQTAFKWLAIHGLIKNVGKGFTLTDNGDSLLAEASSESNNVFDHLKYIEKRFSKISG